MATEVVKSVDLGGTGDYASLTAWEAAGGGCTSTDLPSEDEIAIAICQSTDSSDETSQVYIMGWTTDTTRYIDIRGTSYGGKTGDFPSDGIYDNTKYLLSVSDQSAGCIYVREDDVKIHNIQILVTETSTNTAIGIYNRSGRATGTVGIEIDGCIIKGDFQGTGQIYGISTVDGDVLIYNTIIELNEQSDTSSIGIYRPNSIGHIAGVYNCTISGCFNGIEVSYDDCTIKNCAIFNNGSEDIDDNANNTVINRCASDDNVGTNPVDISPGISETDDWNDAFTDYSNHDFSIKDTNSVLYEAGTDNPGSGAYSDDIIGTARS